MCMERGNQVLGVADGVNKVECWNSIAGLLHGTHNSRSGAVVEVVEKGFALCGDERLYWPK